MSSVRDETVLSLSSSTRIVRSLLGLRLVEGSFSVVSKFTSLNLYVKFQYGEQIWKSNTSLKAGCKPKWNSFHQFDLTPCQSIEIIVYDKSILFADSEIGRCKLTLSEISQGHQTEWWSISNINQIVGRVLLTFDLPQEEPNFFNMHSSHNSLEIREEYFKQLESDADKDLMSQLSNYKREKSRNKSSVQEDNIEKIKCDLVQESNRFNDSSLKILFEQAKKENAKLKKAKAEIKRCKENLKRREMSLITEEENVQLEKNKLFKEREEIQIMKSQLSHDSAKLKQERQKLTNEKREIESLTKELGQASKRIHKEKILIKKSSLTARPFFEDDPLAYQTNIISSESLPKFANDLIKTQNFQSEYITF